MEKPVCNICKTVSRDLKQFSKNVFGCPVCYRLYDAEGQLDMFSEIASFTVRKRIFNQLDNELKLNKLFR